MVVYHLDRPFGGGHIIFGFWLALAAALYLARKPKLRALLAPPLLWFFAFYLSVTFAPVSLRPYRPGMTLSPSLLVGLGPPSCILAGLFLAHIPPRPAKALAFATAGCALLMLYLINFTFGRHYAYNIRRMAEFLRQQGRALPVYTDTATRSDLAFFLGFNSKYQLYDFGQEEITAPAWVIVNWCKLRRSPQSLIPPPAIIYQPPASWKLVATIEDPLYLRPDFAWVKSFILRWTGGRLKARLERLNSPAQIFLLSP